MQYQKPFLAGVDEVGRGPLVGPVVAAAVILDLDNPIEGLADSKKLSAKKREALFIEINDKALAVAVGRAEAFEIDEINILQASLLAMQRAVYNLTVRPSEVLVDGNRCPYVPYPVQAIVGGDSKVQAISAASIIAKVMRDRELAILDQYYPGYGFAKHNGYPTKQHMQALIDLGITPQHRRSFGPVSRLVAPCAVIPEARKY